MADNGNNKSSVKGSTIAIIILSIVVVILLIVIFAGIGLYVFNSSTNPVVENEITTEEVTPDAEANTMDNNTLTPDPTNPVTNVAPTTLSNDWKNTEFALNGENYKIHFDYSQLQNAGWTFDLADYGYSNGYIMNQNDKVSGTISLENPNYDARVSVGFTNTSATPKDILQCQIWTIDVDNSFAKKPVTFNLPNGIHNGSTLEEVVAAYGEPEEDDKYRADSLGYWTYTYKDGYDKYLKLTIYDDKGVTAFSYDVY